ncbi:helix-turn-helix and ligand-binding sensor domain-containing protein [Compostibacter hankyongensis]|uniref:HTH luxR-type domain-containing protein n=1 Tax=Compostibacter hankyongensis TaxID=1007089 RepID=A0ABP8FJU7_9BACT
MSCKQKNILLLFGLLCLGNALPARHLSFPGVPRIINYTNETYGGYNQNWSVTQDENGVMYFANSKGLLSFDGSRWELYELPDKQIVRSVSSDGKGRIYTGGFAELGYWQRQPWGKLVYHSLASRIKAPLFRQEEIWKILASRQEIFFQSFSTLYFLRGGKVSTVKGPNSLFYLFRVRGRDFVQVLQYGLYELQDGHLVKIPGSDFLAKAEVISILPYGRSSFLIGTDKQGLFLYDGHSFRPFDSELSDFLQANELNNGIQLDGDTYAFGTILNGLVIADGEGNILFHLNQSNGLQNNTVLALFRDRAGNLWAAMDKGIDQVVLHSPFLHYRDTKGRLGTVYAAAVFHGRLYIGTNHGLFVKDLGDGQNDTDGFSLIPELKGQVWNLSVFDGQLLCGHNRGTFRIGDHRIVRLSTIGGGWVIRRLKQDSTALIQGTYNGLVIYRKDASGNWAFANQVKGSQQLPVQQLEEDESGRIWIRHVYKSIYDLRLSPDLGRVTSIREMDRSSGLPAGVRYNLFWHDGAVAVASPAGIFKWVESRRHFVADTALKSSLGSYFYSRRIIPAGPSCWWLIKDDNRLGYLENPSSPDIYTFYTRGFPLVSGFEAIVPVGDGSYLLGNEDGFGLFDKKRLHRQPEAPAPAIREISCSAGGRTLPLDSLLPAPGSYPRLAYRYNSLSFRVAVPVYDRVPHFRFMLQRSGEDGVWSSWSGSGTREYGNLSPGSYVFWVMSDVSDERVSFSFEILPPWYRSVWAKTGYLLLLAGIVLLFYRLHRLKLRRQHARLQRRMEKRLRAGQEQSERKLLLFQQQQLEQDVLRKSEALANSTLNLIKEKELFQKIRKELKNIREEAGKDFPVQHYQRLMRTLDKHMDSRDEWKLFEEGFNTVHETFFKKLLERYPGLSPQDLKLAAYLKMNLSSKEIAPLLNISVRGVEIKRYRLRKRLDLPQDQNLTEFMMNI